MEARKRWHTWTIIQNATAALILLIVLMGIIEILRFADAWTTLQRVTRDAARYASSGQYDGERYPLDGDPAGESTGIVPCVIGDERGISSTYAPNGDSETTIQIYTEGIESVFATWYGGIDCDPTNPVHQEMRKDMVRILSIMDEAGIAGAHLWQDSNSISTLSYQEMEQPWYQVWTRPPQDFDQPGWYNITICSSRHLLDPNSSIHISIQPNRFMLMLEEKSRLPVCLLNEIPSDAAMRESATNNAGIPWLDPGGPDDLVTVVVTYNYPLLPPFGLLVPYVQLQAQRVAINESFSGAPAVNSLGVNELTPTPG